MGNKAMKIEDICKVSSSKRIFAREYVETGVPFWRGKEVTEHATGKNDSKGLFISAKRYNELKQTGNVPSDDDVLITAVGTIGSIYQIKHEDLPFYFKDGNIIRLSNWNTDRVNPTYVSLFLRSQIGQQAIKEVEIGSTQKALTIKDIAKVPILLPELKTQNDIVAAIGVIDAKIKINQQINKNLLQMMENCYRKMLKNAIYNHQSKQSNILTVADNIITGKTPSTKNPGYYGGDTPFITIPDMQGNVFVTVTKKRLTQSGTSVQQNKEIPALSLNVSCIGTVGLVTINPTVAHTNQQINSVIVSKDKLWELFFELRSLKGVMENMASGGTTILNMNKAIFSKLQINLLSPAIRKQFNAYANPIFEQILINDEQNHKLAKVRDLLLPKLLAGQIDLSNLEGAIQNA